MPTFQIKDLTVSINQNVLQLTPNLKYCHFGCTFLHTPNCGWCSFHLSCGWCSFKATIVDCGLTPLGCTPTLYTTDIFKDRTWQEVVLPSLKRTELEELRAGIAELHNRVETQLKQTPDDRELLESKLREALEEVTKQRGANG